MKKSFEVQIVGRSSRVCLLHGRQLDGFILGFSMLLQSACVTGAPETWQGAPAVRLHSSTLSAVVLLPDGKDGFYRGPRFDWSGMVAQVTHQGHTYFGAGHDLEQHDPTRDDHVVGTAEEFGMDSPPGFDEALPGQGFIKIGVGVLERPNDQPYFFRNAYRLIDGGAWEVTSDARRVTYKHTLSGPDGWGYVYEKTVSLDPDSPTMRIQRRLTNTGKRPIKTIHYGHNFLEIDEPAGAPYKVSFPFAAIPSEGFNTAGYGSFRGGSFDLTSQVGDKAMWGMIEGWAPVPTDNSLTVHNERTGAAVSIDTDRPLAKLVIYAKRPTLCPEPFVSITVAESESMTWTTTYRFKAEREYPAKRLRSDQS